MLRPPTKDETLAEFPDENVVVQQSSHSHPSRRLSTDRIRNPKKQRQMDFPEFMERPNPHNTEFRRYYERFKQTMVPPSNEVVYLKTNLIIIGQLSIIIHSLFHSTNFTH